MFPSRASPAPSITILVQVLHKKIMNKHDSVFVTEFLRMEKITEESITKKYLGWVLLTIGDVNFKK